MPDPPPPPDRLGSHGDEPRYVPPPPEPTSGLPPRRRGLRYAVLAVVVWLVIGLGWYFISLALYFFG
jgi:hypothetical protein